MSIQLAVHHNKNRGSGQAYAGALAIMKRLSESTSFRKVFFQYILPEMDVCKPAFWRLRMQNAAEKGKRGSTGQKNRTGRPGLNDPGKRAEKYGKSMIEEKTGRNLRGERKNAAEGNKKDRRDHKSLADNAAPDWENKTRQKPLCAHFGKCGGCKYLNMPYEEQLALKRRQIRKLMEKHGKVRAVIGMENPFHYRHKVHAVFGLDKKKSPISGVYEEKSHRVLPVETCLIEDEKADAIIGTIRSMLKSFKIKVYDEDTDYGLLRYVLIRKACFTDEIMVVLVTVSPVFPSKRNFVDALRKVHPEITTVVHNVNSRRDSMILGDKFQPLYGRGYIVDELCGFKFKISPSSFYQVNPEQAAKLYEKAIGLADLTGRETVVDAYCGTGAIGIIASKRAGKVIGVESNADAVRDAVSNAKANDVKNIRFYKDDAGHFLQSCAADGISVDVVLMDPPRAGSSEEFLDALAWLAPKRVVYVSCNPETMERDVSILEKKGYRAEETWGVDMFPWTGHVETVVLLTHKNG